ncbi:MAG: hypothetical protein FJ161_01820 [Gammaproteobacteria bacterium]|nr:hypothetical protein [Gammaproteobacteria bacterium]
MHKKILFWLKKINILHKGLINETGGHQKDIQEFVRDYGMFGLFFYKTYNHRELSQLYEKLSDQSRENMQYFFRLEIASTVSNIGLSGQRPLALPIRQTQLCLYDLIILKDPVLLQSLIDEFPQLRHMRITKDFIAHILPSDLLKYFHSKALLLFEINSEYRIVERYTFLKFWSKSTPKSPVTPYLLMYYLQAEAWKFHAWALTGPVAKISHDRSSELHHLILLKDLNKIEVFLARILIFNTHKNPAPFLELFTSKNLYGQSPLDLIITMHKESFDVFSLLTQYLMKMFNQNELYWFIKNSHMLEKIIEHKALNVLSILVNHSLTILIKPQSVTLPQPTLYWMPLANHNQPSIFSIIEACDISMESPTLRSLILQYYLQLDYEFSEYFMHHISESIFAEGTVLAFFEILQFSWKYKSMLKSEPIENAVLLTLAKVYMRVAHSLVVSNQIYTLQKLLFEMSITDISKSLLCYLGKSIDRFNLFYCMIQSSITCYSLAKSDSQHTDHEYFVKIVSDLFLLLKDSSYLRDRWFQHEYDVSLLSISDDLFSKLQNASSAEEIAFFSKRLHSYLSSILQFSKEYNEHFESITFTWLDRITSFCFMQDYGDALPLHWAQLLQLIGCKLSNEQFFKQWCPQFYKTHQELVQDPKAITALYVSSVQVIKEQQYHGVLPPQLTRTTTAQQQKSNESLCIEELSSASNLALDNIDFGLDFGSFFETQEASVPVEHQPSLLFSGGSRLDDNNSRYRHSNIP